VLFLKVPKRQMAAFDDLGKISASSLVLEKGTYSFFLGGSVRDAVRMDYTWAPAENRIVEVLSSKLAPSGLEKRLMSDGTYEALPAGPAHDMNACAFEKMESGTEECICPAQRGREAFSMFHPYKNDARPLKDVADGKMTAEEFAEQLSDDDLLSLLGGTPNRGVANTFGIGDIPEYGIPAVMTADGPAGVRLEERCGIRTTAWPCETLLAATWNTELVSQVGSAAAGELKENNLHIWLAPAMNIHRSPLCGRNFEYYSEDPVLTGKMAAAEVRGIQENGVAACIKHFACNNKEVNRKHSDSRVSERALREIYLRGFEIAVKEGDPWVLMTSYNAINGQRSSESRELLTDILRGEWGYRGAVITDWWNRGEHYKEILAGNDVKMAAGFPERVRKAMDLGLVTREDLKKCAVRVLEMICKLD
jgi:beta-glucosidase